MPLLTPLKKFKPNEGFNSLELNPLEKRFTAPQDLSQMLPPSSFINTVLYTKVNYRVITETHRIIKHFIMIAGSPPIIFS